MYDRPQLSWGVSLLYGTSPVDHSVPAMRSEVVIAPDSLVRSASGAVTGQLWLRFTPTSEPGTEPQAFPGEAWSDFPVPLLSWWLDSLGEVAQGRPAELRFMDGPYALALAPGSDGQLRVSGHGIEATITQADFARSVRNAAVRTLAVCDARGWSSRDILQCRRAVARATHYRAG